MIIKKEFDDIAAATKNVILYTGVDGEKIHVAKLLSLIVSLRSKKPELDVDLVYEKLRMESGKEVGACFKSICALIVNNMPLKLSNGKVGEMVFFGIPLIIGVGADESPDFSFSPDIIKAFQGSGFFEKDDALIVLNSTVALRSLGMGYKITPLLELTEGMFNSVQTGQSPEYKNIKSTTNNNGKFDFFLRYIIGGVITEKPREMFPEMESEELVKKSTMLNKMLKESIEKCLPEHSQIYLDSPYKLYDSVYMGKRIFELSHLFTTITTMTQKIDSVLAKPKINIKVSGDYIKIHLLLGKYFKKTIALSTFTYSNAKEYAEYVKSVLEERFDNVKISLTLKNS